MKKEENIQRSTSNAQRPTRRIRALVARALREKARAGAHYAKADEALAKAREEGLAVDQLVDVALPDENGAKKITTFALRDNFAGESAFRSARIPHFELKKVPMFSRGRSAAPSGDEKGGES
jgi:hypothetical protein